MALIRTGADRQPVAPTLNLDFANSKSLDSRVTFYRDSIGTYYDSTGVLRYASENEPRFDHNPETGESKGLIIEETKTNLTTSGSYFFDWFGLNRVAVIQNAAKSPDGRFNASKVVDAPDGNNARHELWRQFSAVSGQTYTFSIYAKAAEHTRFEMVWYGDNGVFGGTSIFDLDSETATDGSGFNARMENVGNGWYRCSASRTSGATAAGYYGIYMVEESTNNATYVGVADGGMYFWGTQFETGSYATSYIPDDTRFATRGGMASYHDKDGVLRLAAKNQPRYGYKYDGSKWVEAGLIVEDASTNLIIDSYYQSNAGHGVAGLQNANLRAILNASNESTTAPDGSKIPILEGRGLSGGAYFYPDEGVTAGSDVCFSVYAKRPETANGYDAKSFVLYTHTGRFPAYAYLAYDFVDKRISLIPTGSHIKSYGVEDVGNGWIRIWLAGVPDNTGAHFSFVCYFSDEQSNGTSVPLTNILTNGHRYGYIWGAQMENTRTPTSYIETRGSAETRQGDVLSTGTHARQADRAYIDGQSFADIYNEDQSTLYIDYQLGGKLGQIRVASLTSGSNSDYIDIVGGWGTNAQTTGGAYAFGPVSNGSDINTSGSFITNVVNERRKFAVRISPNDYYARTTNSTTSNSSTDTDAGIPIINALNFGDWNLDQSQMLSGHLRKIAYYSEALSNDEIIALTEME